MVLYCLITAFTILPACFVVNRPALQLHQVTRQQAFNYVCLAGMFVILAGTAALRVEVGNDYGKYVDTFHEIYAGTDEAYVVTEAGFNFVVKAVYTLSGFENYLLVFALFGAATVFLFLKAMYDGSADFKGSFAMFMLLGLYFRTFTTVRYYFVLAIALYSLKYVRRKEYGKFVLLIAFAALFHKSVLLVIPLYILANICWRRWMIVLLAVMSAGVFIFQQPLLNLALEWYPTYKDTVYLSQDIGLRANASGILRCLFVFGTALVCWKDSVQDSQDNRFYLKLNLFGLLFYTCASFLPLVSRLAYYLVTPQILLVPGLIKGIRSPKKKKLVTAAAVIFCFGYFIYFLKTASGGGIRVLPYKTWIFTEWGWINGSDFF